ncbi:MAG: tetrahydromethanopterin S-methyltransferase subunit H, partial [Methanobacteriota archaeon]
MFKFKTPQKIFQIGKVKIGGQPGELPKVLIGTIFYEKHDIVKDPKTGAFDKEKAEELIKKQDGLSELTGNPCMLDIVCTSVESGQRYIDFVAGATDAPISVDIMEPKNKPGILKYVGEAGLADRVLYNSIWFPKEDEINALKDSKIKAAILLGYNVK